MGTLVQPIISVTDLSKTYATGVHALKDIDLEIRRGEIFALLGPNSAKISPRRISRSIFFSA